jgi:hypothetical protein
MVRLIVFRLEKEAQLRSHSYGDTLKEQFILNATETLSNDECVFVLNVIEKVLLINKFYMRD